MLNTSVGHCRELSNLVKIYINDAKYSNRNDSFIFKSAIFYNIFLTADIQFKVKIKAFSIIFKGLALDYYYVNISISVIALNFAHVYDLIRNYFERVEYK